jgi:Caspase domain
MWYRTFLSVSGIIAYALALGIGDAQSQPDRVRILLPPAETREHQAPPGASVEPPRNVRPYAILVGNSQYQQESRPDGHRLATIPRADGDADLIAARLARIWGVSPRVLTQDELDNSETTKALIHQYRLIVAHNVKYSGIRNLTDSLIKKLTDKRFEGSKGIFYYSGHGASVDGSNYVFGTDTHYNIAATKAAIELAERRRDTVNNHFPANGIQLQGEIANLNTLIGGTELLLIMDACRNNPISSEFKPAQPSKLNLISGVSDYYANSPGFTTEQDPERGSLLANKISLYFQSDAEVHEIFKRITREVEHASTGSDREWSGPRQVPEFGESEQLDWCLAGCGTNSRRLKREDLLEQLNYLSRNSSLAGVDYMIDTSLRRVATAERVSVNQTDVGLDAASPILASSSNSNEMSPTLVSNFQRTSTTVYDAKEVGQTVGKAALSYDVFWCDSDGEAAASELRLKEATHISQRLKRFAKDHPRDVKNVRLRSLSVTANSLRRYRYLDNYIVFDRASELELEAANWIKKNTRPKLAMLPGSGSRQYVSVFVCHLPKANNKPQHMPSISWIVSDEDHKPYAHRVLSKLSERALGAKYKKDVYVDPARADRRTKVKFYKAKDRRAAYMLADSVSHLQGAEVDVDFAYDEDDQPGAEKAVIEVWLDKPNNATLAKPSRIRNGAFR